MNALFCICSPQALASMKFAKSRNTRRTLQSVFG